MKSYYQQEKGGFKLDKRVYAKTVKDMQCYYLFLEKMTVYDNKSEQKIKEKDIENAVVAERYVAATEAALKNYVDKLYRDAVFDHIIKGIDYIELEYKYHLGIPAMKKWVQRYVYGVAQELGEDFQ